MSQDQALQAQAAQQAVASERENLQPALRQEKAATLTDTALGQQQILQHVHLIQETAKAVMQEGMHFGVIPGCGSKPTLLKPGAEMLITTFQLAPTYQVNADVVDGCREYTVTCTLTSRVSGTVVGQGLGSCSSAESRYRYRTNRTTVPGTVPQQYWQNRNPELLPGKANAVAKVGGSWVPVQNERVPNPDIADTYNTILKMAKKRALVDAVLSATAASSLFTQDIEDNPDLYRDAPPAPRPTQPAPQPAPQPQRPAPAPRQHAPAPAPQEQQAQQDLPQDAQGPRGASTKQRNFIAVLCRRLGDDENSGQLDVRRAAIMRAVPRVTSPEKATLATLTSHEASCVIDVLQDPDFQADPKPGQAPNPADDPGWTGQPDDEIDELPF